MKSLLQTKKKNSVLATGLLLFMLMFISISSYGQSRTGFFAPWCDLVQYQDDPQYNYAAAIEEVWIKTNGREVFHKKPDGYGWDYTMSYGWTVPGSITNKPFEAINLVAGQTYALQVSLNSMEGCCDLYWMAWIDYDIDYEFSSEENITDGKAIGTSNTSNNTFYLFDEVTFTIPCDAKEGLTRLRINSTNYSGYIAANKGCNTVSSNAYYGETEDLYINIISPTTLKADFVVPDEIWANAPQILVNKYPMGASYSWSKGHGYDFFGDDYATVFPAAGKYDVKLRAENCLGVDTIVKKVTVKDIKSIPNTNFVASKNVLTEGDEFTLFDISTNAPYLWDWSITNPNDRNFKYDNSNILRGKHWEGSYYEALFQIFDVGQYDVSLTSTNVLGSQMANKSRYLDVQKHNDFLLGKGVTETEASSGRILDAGGANDDYPTGAQGKSSINRLLIMPCGAEEITLRIEKIVLGNAKHALRVYDGDDNQGTPLHPDEGFNMTNTTPDVEVTAYSGAMFIEFDAQADGSDDGIVAFFDTKLGTTSPAVPYFEQVYPAKAYERAEVEFSGSVKNLEGLSTVRWTVDGFEVSPHLINGDKMTYTFNNPGVYNVCLEANTCTGDSAFCRSIEVFPVKGITDIDIETSDDRPAVNQVVSLNGLTNKADRFQWMIVPTSYEIYSGNLLGKRPQVRFTKAGSYSVSLRAWNSEDSLGSVNFIVKNNFIVAVDPCIPYATDFNNDVSTNRVTVYDEDDNIIFNHNSAGSVGYKSYLDPIYPTAEVIFGKTYSVEIHRNSTADPVARSVYIDFNSDGSYDASELVLHESTSKNKNAKAQFTVPSIDNAYYGTTRMRVITAYGVTDEFAPCGPGVLGEYKDYRVTFVRNPVAPVITLNGADTIEIEAGAPYSDLGATAYDVIDGDLTSKIIDETNVEANQSGIYFHKYSVRNSSGVVAQKERIINVSYDKTAPVITLNGDAIDTIEVNSGVYNDPWATAIDNIDGDVTSEISVIGEVDYTELGVYTLTYTVSDVQGNTATIQRTVYVLDRTAPEFVFYTDEKIQLGKFWYDQTEVKDNYWNTKDIMYKVEYGANGPVQWNVEGTYPTTYKATDGSGNYNEVTRNYEVGDFLAPTVLLNTPDTVYHEVKTPYVRTSPTIYDNYYSNGELTITQSSDVNADVLGLYKDEYSVSDPSGNTTDVTRWIKVVDTKSPVISGDDICSEVGTDFNLLVGLTIDDNYYSESELMDLVEVVRSNINVWFMGMYDITYKVVDPSGNVSNYFNRDVKIDTNCALITSVNEIELNNMFNVYPNPNNGIFTVEFSGVKTNVKTIEVINSVGTVVSRIDASNMKDKVELNLSGEASGVYLVRLTAENGSSASQKVIVTK